MFIRCNFTSLAWVCWNSAEIKIKMLCLFCCCRVKECHYTLQITCNEHFSGSLQYFRTYLQAVSTFSPISLWSRNGMCVCVCVCVCVMNLKYALNWHINIIFISSFRTVPVPQAHAHMHPQTIWGQWTDGAKSGYCLFAFAWWPTLVPILIWSPTHPPDDQLKGKKRGKTCYLT